MELFIFSWEVINENPISIRGHGLDCNNVYDTILIHDYEAFCYYESTCLKDTVEPMQTSDDLFITKNFIKKYSKYRKELRGHMSEIPLISLFTASTGLDFTGWIHTTTRRRIEKDIHPLPLILSFDIEVSSQGHGMPLPYIKENQVEMISCIFQRYTEDYKEIFLLHLDDAMVLDNAICIQCTDELDMIDMFFYLIAKLNPDIITGFNIYGFDFEYLISRLQYHMHYTTMCTRPLLDHFKAENVNWESSAYGYNNYQKIKINGRIIFDMMLYFKRFKLEKYSLQVISEHFLKEGKDDMPYEEMFECFRTRQNLDKVARYCIQDSLLVLKLFNKFCIWNELCETSKIMRCDIEDIYTRGEQLKVTNQMVKECISRNIVLVKRDTQNRREYKGATVLDPIKGIHDHCVVLDFQSLYPSIVIAFNICPSTYKNNFSKGRIGLFPSCIKNLLDARKSVKDLIKNCREADPILGIVLDKRQNALKVCANSMYGTMGFASNPYFGCIPCAEMVTMLGREVLIRTIEFININYHVQVIYGDTDSCMLKFPNRDCIELSKEIADQVSKQLPYPMSLKFEEYYKKMILMNKKRYIMIKEDNSLKYKGVIMARRGYCQFAKDIYREVIMMISKSCTCEEVQTYIDEKMIALYQDKVPLKELTITKSVKDLSDYKTDVPQLIMANRLRGMGVEITAGTRLEYVFVQVNSGLQGHKMYTPEEVRNHHLKIDYKYYAVKQISSQVDEVLQFVGIKDYVKYWF